jgi:NADH:ubiquinone oxidoreductase subunit F (NADH-binding)
MPGSPRISYSNVTPDMVPALLTCFREVKSPPPFGRALRRTVSTVPRFFDHPMLARQERIVLRNCGIIDPENIDHYLARDGYRALERCLTLPWTEVLEIVKASGLRGRGGAGFPTWRKWLVCRETESDKRYLICNADEGDRRLPNRSSSKEILTRCSRMLIAAYTIGAGAGFVYIRAEYPLAIEFRSAIVQMRQLGLLGDRILGGDFSFDIKIKRGLRLRLRRETVIGHRGRRGMPRTRPFLP